METASPTSAFLVGRYAICGEIACGGMATVHHGLFRGETGFARTVAIKRLHAHYAKDREFSEMLRDEARLTARVRHPHVVSTLDVAVVGDEFLLVMDYIHGESLSRLLRAAQKQEGFVPRDILSAIFCGALHGLHAAHDATDEAGTPLRIVHRDASPQNIMVGADGIARVLDFGIAKAVGRSQTTRNGELKGKLAYMAPEQLTNKPVDRRTDVYAIGVVLWEALTLERLFPGDSEGFIVARIMEHRIDKPSVVTTQVSPALDAVVMKALARDPADRYASAREMALALEAAVPVASATKVAAWVEELAGESLRERAHMVAGAENSATELLSGAAARKSVAEAPPFPAPKPDTESDLATATSVVSVGASAQIAAAAAKAAQPARGRWLSYAGLVLAGAGIATLAMRGVATRALASRAPAATVSTSASASPSPSSSPPVDAPSAPSAEAAAPIDDAPPPPPTAVAEKPRPRPPRPEHRTSAKPSPSASAKGGQHCDWHNEQGIWVPTNCR